MKGSLSKFLFVLVAVYLSQMLMASQVRALEFDKGLSIEALGFVDFTVTSGDSYKSQTLGGTTITQASADANVGRDNGFHYTRAYITIKDQINENLSGRFTYDEKDGYSGKAFVKFVYGEYIYAPGQKAIFGLGPTPWNYYVEGFYTYRFLGPVFADVQGAQSSADQGLSLVGSFMDKMIDYHVGVYEGEGYTGYKNKAGTTIYSDGQGFAYAARISANLLGGLNISLFDWMESKRGGYNDFNPSRLIGMVTYGTPMFRVGGEYLMADDNKSGNNQTGNNLTEGQFNKGTGFSLWGHVRIPGMEALRVFARYDSMTPDKDLDHNGKNSLTLGASSAGTNSLAKFGVSYDLSKSVVVALEDAIKTNKIDSSDGSTTDNLLAVKAQVAF